MLYGKTTREAPASRRPSESDNSYCGKNTLKRYSALAACNTSPIVKTPISAVPTITNATDIGAPTYTIPMVKTAISATPTISQAMDIGTPTFGRSLIV